MAENDTVWVVFMTDSKNQAHVVSVHKTEDEAMGAADLMSQSVAPFSGVNTAEDVQDYVDHLEDR